jgi:hypothetical protein
VAEIQQLRGMVEQTRQADDMLRQAQFGLETSSRVDPGVAAEVANLATQLASATPEESPLLLTRMSIGLSHVLGGETVPRLDQAREQLATREAELAMAMRQKAEELARATPEQAGRIQNDMAALTYLLEATQAAGAELAGVQRDIQRKGMPIEPMRLAALERLAQQGEQLIRSTPEGAARELLDIARVRQAFNGKAREPQLDQGRDALATREGELLATLRNKSQELGQASPAQAEKIRAEMAQIQNLLDNTHAASGQLAELQTYLDRHGVPDGKQEVLTRLRQAAEELTKASPEEALMLQVELDSLDNQLRGGEPQPELDSAREVLAVRAGELINAMRQKAEERVRATPEHAAKIDAELQQLDYLMDQVRNALGATGRIEEKLRSHGPLNDDQQALLSEVRHCAEELAMASPEEASELVGQIKYLESAI